MAFAGKRIAAGQRGAFCAYEWRITRKSRGIQGGKPYKQAILQR
jgi:hypothetical protein